MVGSQAAGILILASNRSHRAAGSSPAGEVGPVRAIARELLGTSSAPASIERERRARHAPAIHSRLRGRYATCKESGHAFTPRQSVPGAPPPRPRRAVRSPPSRWRAQRHQQPSRCKHGRDDRHDRRAVRDSKADGAPGTERTRLIERVHPFQSAGVFHHELDDDARDRSRVARMPAALPCRASAEPAPGRVASRTFDPWLSRLVLTARVARIAGHRSPGHRIGDYC